MFTLYLDGEEGIFLRMVNLVHESMFSNFSIMTLQDCNLCQSLWLVSQSSKLFQKANGV